MSRTGSATEQPTLATSGSADTLRFAVLIPAPLRTVDSELALLVIADREGAVIAERELALLDRTGAPSATATLHSPALAGARRDFFVLSEAALDRLDEGGALVASVPLAVAPMPEWQRSAGWLDDDRFVFVTSSASREIAVFDRATSAVTTTPIAVRDAARVHVEPGGITVSPAPALEDIVVYAPDLGGAIATSVSWPEPLGPKLLGVATIAGERAWLVSSGSEFRTELQTHRIPSDGGEPILIGSGTVILGPLTTSLEGGAVSIVSGLGGLTIYDFESGFSTELRAGLTPETWLEPERDGAHFALLARDAAGALWLECGL